jgi:hypothetical protein
MKEMEDKKGSAVRKGDRIQQETQGRLRDTKSARVHRKKSSVRPESLKNKGEALFKFHLLGSE